MEVSCEDISFPWQSEGRPPERFLEFQKWRTAVFQDMQESFDASKLYFLYDPIADEECFTNQHNGKRGDAGLVIFDTVLRCFTAEIPILTPGRMKFLFALKCPSSQGSSAFVLVTEERFTNNGQINIYRLELARDAKSIANIRPLVQHPITVSDRYVVLLRNDTPELVVMVNPGIQISRIDCMSEYPHPPISSFSIPGADLKQIYDAFLNNGNIVFLSSTDDDHFDNSRVHLINLESPQQIITQPCIGDPLRGRPLPRKECGIDSIGNSIIIAGGEYDFGYGGKPERLADYWMLDTRTYQWTQIPTQMPVQLIETRLTVANSGNIYTWGDYDEPINGMEGTHLRLMKICGLEMAEIRPPIVESIEDMMARRIAEGEDIPGYQNDSTPFAGHINSGYPEYPQYPQDSDSSSNEDHLTPKSRKNKKKCVIM